MLSCSCDNVCDGGIPTPICLKPKLRHKPSDVNDIAKVVRDLGKSSYCETLSDLQATTGIGTTLDWNDLKGVDERSRL